MSEQEKGLPKEVEELQHSGEPEELEPKDISRRQFLNYALMGTGGFLAAMPLVPMLRFAVDPLLQSTEAGEMTEIGPIDEFGPTPKMKEFTVATKDAWYETETTHTAWIYKQEDGSIMAMSGICTHLGCNVSWASNENYPNQFFCPCHGGRYKKNGVNIEGTPPTAPLPVYEQKIENGILYLGKPVPRKGA